MIKIEIKTSIKLGYLFIKEEQKYLHDCLADIGASWVAGLSEALFLPIKKENTKIAQYTYQHVKGITTHLKFSSLVKSGEVKQTKGICMFTGLFSHFEA